MQMIWRGWLQLARNVKRLKSVKTESFDQRSKDLNKKIESLQRLHIQRKLDHMVYMDGETSEKDQEKVKMGSNTILRWIDLHLEAPYRAFHMRNCSVGTDQPVAGL